MLQSPQKNTTRSLLKYVRTIERRYKQQPANVLLYAYPSSHFPQLRDPKLPILSKISENFMKFLLDLTPKPVFYDSQK